MAKTKQKAVVKKPIPEKKVKPVQKKMVAAPKPEKKPAAVVTSKKAVEKVEIEAPAFKIKPLPTAELKQYRSMLETLRDRIMDEIQFLAGDNLNRSQRDSSGDLSSYSFHMADQGTDNFDREFALNLVSSEQDVLYEINEAIARIENKSYGTCEQCGNVIDKARLKALPFAKMCTRCKAESEKGKTRYRPFGQTITQMPES